MSIILNCLGPKPGRIPQSVGHLTRKLEVLVRYPAWPHTFVSPSADSRGAVSCQLLAKVCVRITGLPLRRSKPAQEKCG